MTVVFVEYEIVTKTQGNQINWSTILESNLAKYEIQRSAANQTFETIGTIQAKGTTSVHSRLQFYRYPPQCREKYLPD